MIFDENEPGLSFYIIKSGSVNIIKNKVILRQIGKKGWFGERAIVLGENRTARVQASSRVKLWALSSKNFLDIVDSNIRRQVAILCNLQNNNLKPTELKVVKEVGVGSVGTVYFTVYPEKKFKYSVRVVRRKTIQKK